MLPLSRARPLRRLALVAACLATSATAPAPREEAPAAAAPAPAKASAKEAASSDALLEQLDNADPDVALPPVIPSREKDPPIGHLQSLKKADDVLAQAHRNADGRLVVTRDGKSRTLTIVPDLQQSMTELLRSYQTPYAAVVAIEPSTGKVLAMAEHAEAAPAMRGLSVRAVFPAASIFKLITATALLHEGVTPDESECFHGGKRRLQERLLEDSRRDGKCLTMAQALAKSANVVFAKLTQRYLTSDKLRAVAEAFRFNKPLPFAIPADRSLAAIPPTGFELAATGAGFGDVYLSPLHGAAVAAVAANGGVWRDPVLFEDQAPKAPPSLLRPEISAGTDTPTAGDGQDEAEGEAPAPLPPVVPVVAEPADDARVMTADEAKALADMMEETVTQGTARRIFRQRGFRVPGAVGKTGTLADRNPFRDYSWFVGFAPKDHPQIAVAAVVVNDAHWRIRAPYVAREAMRQYLERHGAPAVQAMATPSEDE